MISIMKHLLLTTIAAVVLVGCGGPSGIHKAAKAGNIKAVKQHLDAGADVELKCVNCGGTILGHAAVGGSKEVGELLIAKGADVNAKQKGGGTPLDLAIQFKEPETADLLRKHGGKTGEELKAEGK
jgi:cytohesin